LKLQPDLAEGINVIQHYGAQGVRVAEQWWNHSILLPAQGSVRPWAVEAAPDLQEAHFAAALELPCELIILGSGPKLRFPPPAALAPLMRRRIGLETMDTAAACRTFNILAAEGRKVLAALILPL
jgi:uncharacterized protein